jgi:MFS family permease
MRSLEFWLIFIPFSVYVGLFNAISSLFNQILEPHGFSETQAGITGGLLIIVGLVSAAIFSPITDRYKHYLAIVKIMVPIIAATFIGFVFIPSARSIAAIYVFGSFMGAASFTLLPVALEFIVETTYPISAEIGSSICWTGGSLLGGIFIIAETALKAGPQADPPLNMTRAMIFQAVIAAAAVPFPLCLGLFGRKVIMRRLEAERGSTDIDNTNNLSASRPSRKRSQR